MSVAVEIGRRPPGVSVRPSPIDAATASVRAAFPTLLVSMPMVRPDRPSLALGLLAAIGREHGFPVETLHANLEFARLAGYATAEAISRRTSSQFGEWLFAGEAFGDDVPELYESFPTVFADDIAALATWLSGMIGRTVTPEELVDLRQTAVPALFDRLLRTVDWANYRVVGFTSTFQQNVATIAMADRLVERYDDLTIIVGGANLDGTMGRALLEATPSIHYAVSGEGDAVFPALLAALAHGTDPLAIPGVLGRDPAHPDRVTGTSARPIDDMDDLPVPDYDEYFVRRHEHGQEPTSARRTTILPYESSRGCWWGERSHCTFCGLNSQTMQHRSKSPDRVVAELSELASRYRSMTLHAADNILDRSYFAEVLPRLTDAELDYELFYEVKANLDRSDIRALARAGVTSIQPGIESLSSPVLRLMGKGVRASANVNLLRWAEYYGVTVHWAILHGFPGELPEHYAAQADLARHLVHLQPPTGSARIWMERFSPLYQDRDRFPVRRLEPERSYRFVYPDRYDLDELAYFFDYELADELPDSTYDEMRAAVAAWQSRRSVAAPVLRLWRSGDGILIDDERDPDEPTSWRFRGRLAEIYLACFDTARSARLIAEMVHGASEAEVCAALDAFEKRGLVMRDENLYLALALPRVTGR